MSICSRVFQQSRRKLSRGKRHGPNERADCFPVRGREKKDFAREANFPGGLFLPSCVRSRKRLLFQRNFYIYPSVKRKPRICFYSRILLVTSHSSFPLLFRKPPAAVPPGLVLRVPHTLSSLSVSRLSRLANTRDFQRASLANSSRPTRASVHKQKWFTLSLDRLPRHTPRVRACERGRKRERERRAEARGRQPKSPCQ